MAIVSKGNFEPDACITLPQTQDKRVQIEKTKLYPHLLLYKLYRNPRLLSKEQLTFVTECKYGFERKLNFICINPYHYSEKSDTDGIDLKKNSKHNNMPSELGKSFEYVYEFENETRKFNHHLENSIDRHTEEVWCQIQYFEIDKQSKGPQQCLVSKSSCLSSPLKVGNFIQNKHFTLALGLTDNPSRDSYIDRI
ncbi:MAG: Mothers against decapentaplegic 4, partial [Paramarteilia canceri]